MLVGDKRYALHPTFKGWSESIYSYRRVAEGIKPKGVWGLRPQPGVKTSAPRPNQTIAAITTIALLQFECDLSLSPFELVATQQKRSLPILKRSGSDRSLLYRTLTNQPIAALKQNQLTKGPEQPDCIGLFHT